MVKRWTSHTMTSENFLEIHEKYICYGVESLDDEQAFNRKCLIANFINSEACYWVKVNLSQHYGEIEQTIRKLL
ncbi:MAG: hypothetical protein IPK14_14570 [Blastocatellia bacterium]|nr:hypothetical protein [Blastocatellia bacterium]MBL8196928.1 hypothetical protein [Blastocatellia bacterium]MBN8725702.1 hypothetical protein [Acidobacteriota bacterium]